MYSQPSKFLSLAGLLLAAMIGSPAGAANFTVSSLNDSGAGSLREAIDNANNAAGADTISFTVSGTIILGSTLPNIVDGSEITIDGTGHSITVSGNNTVRVMIVDAQAKLKLKHLTIANGFALNSPTNPGFGGGIENIGTLTVIDSTISGNHAEEFGGGIDNLGTLTVTDSTVSDNETFINAGGIGNGGAGTVTGSTVSRNRAQHGGGIVNAGTLIISATTISDNGAADFGAGILNDGTLTVTNSTISGNVTFFIGGGILNDGTLTVTNSTISDNSAQEGGGISGDFNLANTILANNAGGDCSAIGTVSFSGVNLVEDGSCDPSAITGDPMLGPLADNGGPTLTHALLAGSPAIDAVTAGSCPPPAADQRGVARPQGAHCDIGAYEVENSVDACTTAEVLDNFDRRDGPLGRNWRGKSDTRFYRIHDDQVDVRLGGPVFWNPNRFGSNQAVFVTLNNVDTRGLVQGTLLKVQDGRGPHTGRRGHDDGFGGAIAVTYDGRARAVRVSTNRGGKQGRGGHLYGKTPVTFSDGDKLGACALANGNVRVYKNDVLVTTVKLDKADQAFFNKKQGKLGLWSSFAARAVLDDFGGGTVVP